ncbi:MAG: glycosyl hydrolase family 2 [Bacteroidales bacterium]|nr:glycosyl hydrolase family 2 [Bacteroidales bacterium]
MKKMALVLAGFMLMLGCTTNTTQKKENAMLPPSELGPKKVSLENKDGKYRLYVEGKEFYVKGAGLEFGDIDALGAHQANSFRTWRTENGERDAMDILDQAYKNGLMVMMGLEVGRERHGYSYDDTAWVQKQFEYLKGEVLRLKDHPAMLAWAVGNELNLQTTDLRVYDAVNDIAKMIHELDPNHPTTTTTAGIGRREADYIKEHCPEIDFLSVQMYGDIVNLQQRLEDAGWEGPYMVTEWGATGHWEVYTTPWGANVEQTSREKAQAFTDRYNNAIAVDTVNCLGSYVFLWGQKQERTPTWYGMFLESGEETETVDAMHFIWNGEWPENRCPLLNYFSLNGKKGTDNITLKEGDRLDVLVDADDPDGDALVYHWEIIPESTDLGMGGDHESRPDTVMKREGSATESFDLPAMPGAYRIYIYVLDGNNHAATANIPFFVEV